MSGLGEFGGLPQFGPGYGGQIQQKDIDQYVTDEVIHPSVDAAFIGTASPVIGAVAPIVIKSFTPDYPRNLKYTMTGVAGGVGGTFTASGIDQFGSVVSESVGFASANAGGTKSGTAIFGSIGTITVVGTGLGGTAVGTCSVGFGTATGAPSSLGNWFGLPVRLNAVADVRSITWINNGTATALNKGTNIGTLSNVGGTLPPHAFQGTSGVAITDEYIVTIKPQYDNINRGTMCAF